jgi:bifunctional non-homologous end joining protein LigD
LIFCYYDGGNLRYVARTRNGFTPSSRQELFKRLKALEIQECPFGNLPEATSGRWGARLTAAKMKKCRWLEPVLVGQFEFAKWTRDHHLRHLRFITLRDDKEPKTVLREG